MRNKILIILVLQIIFFINLSGQWEKGFFKDEFSDLTDKSYQRQVALGTFSNTATTNSVCRYELFKLDHSFEIRIFPYNNNHREQWTKNNTGNIYIKSPSGIKDTICANFKNGIIVIDTILINPKFDTYEESDLQKCKDILKLKQGGKISKRQMKELKKEYGYIASSELEKSILELNEEISKKEKMIQFGKKIWATSQLKILYGFLNSESGEFKIIAKYNSSTYKFSFENTEDN